MAVPVGRESSKIKRAARRLRKKGYSGEAGKMFAAAETARLNEPSIMTPAFRAEQRFAGELADAARVASSDPSFDYEKDIAPLRQAFFGNLAASGLPQDQKKMISTTYGAEFDNISDRSIKERSALQGIRASDAAFQEQQRLLEENQKKMREQRETEAMVPEAASALDQILTNDSLKPSQKYLEASKYIRSKPKFFGTKEGSDLAKDALNIIPNSLLIKSREEALDPMQQIALDAAIRSNSVSGIESIEGLPESEKEALKIIARDARDLNQSTNRNKVRNQLITNKITSLNKSMSKLIEGSVKITTVQDVANQVELLARTLGIDPKVIPSFVELQEGLKSDVSAAGGEASKSMGSDFGSRNATDSTVAAAQKAIREAESLALELSSGGTLPQSITTTTRSVMPSMRSRNRINQIANIKPKPE